MKVEDWIYLAMTLVGYLVAVIAGVYAKDKAKINRATAAGKAMDLVGQLATYAVHEAERTEMNGAGKRKWAAEAVSQGLDWLGIKGVTPIAINGAIEKAVAAMNAALNEEVDQTAASSQSAAADQRVADQPAQPAAVDQPSADQPAQPTAADQPAASKEEVEDVK